jgi:hypothetical protein
MSVIERADRSTGMPGLRIEDTKWVRRTPKEDWDERFESFQRKEEPRRRLKLIHSHSARGVCRTVLARQNGHNAHLSTEPFKSKSSTPLILELQ